MAQIPTLLIFLLGSIIVHVSAENNATKTAAVDQKPAASSQAVTYTSEPSFWPDSWRTSLSIFSGRSLLYAGVIGFVVVLISVLGFTWPSSLRMCSLFGTCEKGAINYPTGGNLDPAVQGNSYNDNLYYNYPQYNNVKRKRSIDFSILAPMLTKLASTIENMKETNQPLE